MKYHSKLHSSDHEYGGDDEIIPANIGQYGIAELNASGNVGSPIEGTDIKSTGETGGTKYLRENGDGTCSWQLANDTNAIHDNVSGEINALTGKTTPIDGDEFIIEDSASSYAKAKLTWSNLKATLKTYLDTLYASITHASTHSDGGSDEITVENLATSGSLGTVLTSDGDGSLSMQTRKVEQMLPIAGYPATIGGNQSGYLQLFQSSLNISTTEDYNKVQMPKCSVKAISGRFVSGNSTVTLTIRKNGVDTTVTGSVLSAGTFRITGTGEVSFSEADELSISFSTTSGSGSALAGVIVEYDTELI